MKILSWGKDGGEKSKVWGFWLLEIKSLFSIVILRFEEGSRDAYHEHAFNCASLVWGHLEEHHLDKRQGEARIETHRSLGLIPAFVKTYRDTFHKTVSKGTTYALSFRGPWSNTWREYVPCTNEEEYAGLYGGNQKTLTHGRRVVDAS